jgi:hypothetical protein
MHKLLKKIFPNSDHEWLQSEWIQSLGEFLWIYAISNIPFLALVIMRAFSTEKASFADSINHALSLYMIPGELLVYVSTLLAPFVYVMIQYSRARRNVPFFSIFMIATSVIYIYALIAFSMFKNNVLINTNLLSESTPFFYFISLALWYFSLVFARKLSKPEKNMGHNAQNLIERFNKGDA